MIKILIKLQFNCPIEIYFGQWRSKTIIVRIPVLIDLLIQTRNPFPSGHLNLKYRYSLRMVETLCR